jgi:hypothetical protein
MGTGSFPGVKRPGRGADHPSPPSAEVTNEWSYTSTPPLGLRGVLQGELYFYDFFYRKDQLPLSPASKYHALNAVGMSTGKCSMLSKPEHQVHVSGQLQALSVSPLISIKEKTR